MRRIGNGRRGLSKESLYSLRALPRRAQETVLAHEIANALGLKSDGRNGLYLIALT